MVYVHHPIDGFVKIIRISKYSFKYYYEKDDSYLRAGGRAVEVGVEVGAIAAG